MMKLIFVAKIVFPQLTVAVYCIVCNQLWHIHMEIDGKTFRLLASLSSPLSSL